MGSLRGVRRVELVVVAAIVLSAPTLLQAFSGGITMTSTLLRLVGALVVCWAVGAIVERTLDNYARQARQKELAERIEQVRASRAAFFGAGPPGASGNGAPLEAAASGEDQPVQ